MIHRKARVFVRRSPTHFFHSLTPEESEPKIRVFFSSLTFVYHCPQLTFRNVPIFFPFVCLTIWLSDHAEWSFSPGGRVLLICIFIYVHADSWIWIIYFFCVRNFRYLVVLCFSLKDTPSLATWGPRFCFVKHTVFVMKSTIRRCIFHMDRERWIWKPFPRQSFFSPRESERKGQWEQYMRPACAMHVSMCGRAAGCGAGIKMKGFGMPS